MRSILYESGGKLRKESVLIHRFQVGGDVLSKDDLE